MTAQASQWPSMATLNNAITSQVKQLNSILPHASQLTTNIQALQGSQPIPSLLTQQLTDIETLFETITTIFSFLDDIDVLDNVFEESSKTLESQLKQCKQINAALPTLESAVKNIGNNSQAVLGELPNNNRIASAIDTLNSWTRGASSLVSMINNIETQIASDVQKSQLATIQQQIDTRCSALTTQLQSFNALCTKILTSIHSLNGCLCDYATALKSISQHSTLISQQSLPAVTNAANKMKEIDAILNPISIVLTVAGCSNQPEKRSAAFAIQAVKANAKANATGPANTVSNLINEFVTIGSNGYLPIQPLYDDVTTASQTLNKKISSDLNNQFQSLISDMQRFDTLLSDQYHYTVNNTTQSNQFLNEASITALQTLSSSIN